MKSVLYPLLAAFVSCPMAMAMAGLENIGLHKSYTAVPALGRNSNTFNGEEGTKLTDGKFSKTALWNNPGATVGWDFGQEPIHLTVDLGESRPIAGVAVSTAAGQALSTKEIFFWPGLIDLFVSDDNENWIPVGELTSLNDAENEPLPPFANRYEQRKIATTRLKTHGRYVRFVISVRGHVFLDEVEVYKGDDAWLAEPRAGAAIPGEKLNDQVKRKDATLFVAQRRYRLDIAAILKQLEGLREEEAAPIRQRLLVLKEEVEKLEEQPSDKRASLPVGPIGARILAEQAAVWRAQGKKPVTFWKTAPWEALEWLTPPPETDAALPALEVVSIRDEYRSAAFNITNSTDRAQAWRLKVEGLTLPSASKGKVAFKVYSVEWSEEALRNTIAAALVEVQPDEKGRYEVTVPSGMTRQVWLDFKGPEEAGTFSGKIVAEPVPEGNAGLELPVSLKVYPFRMPDKQKLHVGGWEYMVQEKTSRYGVTPAISNAMRLLLQDYHVDLPWGLPNLFGKGKFNEQHEYTPEGEPKTEDFDEWVRLWPNAHRYNINIAAYRKDGEPAIDGYFYKDDPEGFEKRVANWLRFWRDHVVKIGLKPEQVSLLIVDEPGLHGTPYSQDEAVLRWSNAIAKANMGFQQWCDPVYREPWNANQEALDNMTELTIKYAHLVVYGKEYVDYYRKRGEKQRLFLYECYPAIGGLDPYSYYRLQAWMAWEMKAEGSSFWSFSDNGRQGSLGSWNNGLNILHYSPLFYDQSTVFPGKGLAAIRESVGDYTYLYLLREAIADAEKRGKPASAIAAAKELLEHAPKRVLWENKALQEPKWLPMQPIDRTVADQVRVELLEALMTLRGGE